MTRLRLVAAIFMAAALQPIATAAQLPPGIPPPGMRPLPRGVASILARPEPALLTLPVRLDYRDQGAVTPAKNQGDCGGCWAFAAAGCLESACILASALSAVNFSEQWPLSCDVLEFWGVNNDGCCGGTATVFQFIQNNGIVEEADFPYGEGDFDGEHPRVCDATPQWATIPCPSSPPPTAGWAVDSWALVSEEEVAPVLDMKAALTLHGPLWLGYEVYQDFVDYWLEAAPGTVYSHTSGALLGPHAVLLIGYDDAGQYWIVKNSWGVGGPEGDGTFLISFAANCSFGINATWVSVFPVERPGACCLAGGECQLIDTAENCTAMGGTWNADDDCSPNNCPVVWACCIAGECFMMTAEECDDHGTPPWRTWFQGVACGDINCSTPVEKVTWGRLKHIYR